MNDFKTVEELRQKVEEITREEAKKHEKCNAFEILGRLGAEVSLCQLYNDRLDGQLKSFADVVAFHPSCTASKENALRNIKETALLCAVQLLMISAVAGMKEYEEEQKEGANDGGSCGCDSGNAGECRKRRRSQNGVSGARDCQAED